MVDHNDFAMTVVFNLVSTPKCRLLHHLDNPKGKSAIWKYYGFVKSCETIDKTKIACKLCRTTLKYSGNTTNLTDHIPRKDPTINLKKDVDPVKQSSVPSLVASSQSGQPQISGFFGSKLPSSSQRSIAITNAILTFIVEDLRPFSVVENSGFKNLVNVLEPRYTIPSRQYFSDRAMPELYQSVKSSVQRELADASSVAITTDGWTSRATESYITITSSHIDSDWRLKNFVLQVIFYLLNIYITCSAPHIVYKET